jgi:hypothetical protein
LSSTVFHTLTSKTVSDTDSFILGLYTKDLTSEMKKIQEICDFSNQAVGDYQSGFYSQENCGLVGYLKVDTDIKLVEEI